MGFGNCDMCGQPLERTEYNMALPACVRCYVSGAHVAPGADRVRVVEAYIVERAREAFVEGFRAGLTKDFSIQASKWADEHWDYSCLSDDKHPLTRSLD